MKYVCFVIMIIVLTSCAKAPMKEQEPLQQPIVNQENIASRDNKKEMEEGTPSTEENKEEIVEENKDEYIETLVRKNDKILGVDVKHNRDLVLIMLVFDTSATDKEIKNFLNEYAYKVAQTYGDVITHIQAIRDGVNVLNLVNDVDEQTGLPE